MLDLFLFQCKSFEDAVSNLCEHAMEKLNGIFVHSDAIVLQATAKASEHLLKSQMAHSFLCKFVIQTLNVRTIETKLDLNFAAKYPLLSVFETGTVTPLPLKQKQQQLDLAKLFNDNAFTSVHSYWVKSLAIELFTLFDGDSLAEVAAKQTPFAVAMVPLLVKALLTTRNSNHHQTLNAAIDLFFSKNFTQLSTDQSQVTNVTVYAPFTDSAIEV